jgi:membrane protein
MSLSRYTPLSFSQRLDALLSSLSHFPWKSTAHTLRERFREDRLGLTASSLTFTTTIALVPIITVALAVFTAFPMFAKFQDVLQKWLIESLIPDNIARQVLGYLTQFAGKASKLGVAGVAVLFSTALALIFTIDRTLNSIWRVRKARPWGQRVLVYWAAITLGPLVLGVSLTATSYAVSASKGVVGGMPGGVQLLLDVLQFFLMAGGMAAMYHYVPNILVKWGHAWVGGLFVSAGFELAKKLLTLYLSKVPTYSMVYGAFATVPILLIWIYVAWVIVLLGAVITAYLPSLLAGQVRRPRAHGFQFQLALEAVQQLDGARTQGRAGLTMAQLTQALRVDALLLEPVLETLVELDWLGLLQEEKAEGSAGVAARYVLLANPDTTALAPLIDALLLKQDAATKNLWDSSAWHQLTLRQAL